MYSLKEKSNDGQMNILEDHFTNESFKAATGFWKSWKPVGYPIIDPLVIEQSTRLRLWKLLRELDVMPIFIGHLEEELFQLLTCKLVAAKTPVVKCSKCESTKSIVEQALGLWRGKNGCGGSCKKGIKALKNYFHKITKLWKGDK